MAEVRVEQKRAAWIAYKHAVELELSAGRMRQLFETVARARKIAINSDFHYANSTLALAHRDGCLPN